MSRRLYGVVLLLSLGGSLLLSCKKDKDTNPDNNNNNQNQEQLYVRATVDGKVWEYSEKNSEGFPGYGIGTSSYCNESESALAYASFSFDGSEAFDENFEIEFIKCMNKPVEEVENDCGEMTDWLQQQMSYPLIEYSNASYGASIRIKDPATGKTYVVREGFEDGGSVTITKVTVQGTGSHLNPKFIMTGTFQGRLVDEKASREDAEANSIRISDGTFRIRIGVCPLDM